MPESRVLEESEEEVKKEPAVHANEEIRGIALKACDEMTSDDYEFPTRIDRRDALIVVPITIAMIVLMYVGFSV